MQNQPEAHQIATLLQGVEALGSQFNEEILKKTISLYEPLASKTTSPYQISTEVAYGEHPRQVLDFYESDGESPILLFVHGGGFVAGGKKINDIFYSNVGHYFASRGVAVAMMNYRLAPEFAWPSASTDILQCVSWLREHHSHQRKILLIGQSAGAAHVATYLSDELFCEHAAQNVAGAVLMSGFYNTQSPMSPGARSYFGDDPATLEKRSTVLKVANLKTPLLLTLAQFDPPGIALQTLSLATHLTQVQQSLPPLHYLSGHNHVSTVLSIGSPQDEVGQLLMKFVRQFLK